MSCHVSRAAIYTRVKVRLHFPRELTKELIRPPTDIPTDATPTVTSYPLQTPNTYHPKVFTHDSHDNYSDNTLIYRTSKICACGIHIDDFSSE